MSTALRAQEQRELVEAAAKVDSLIDRAKISREIFQIWSRSAAPGSTGFLVDATWWSDFQNAQDTPGFLDISRLVGPKVETVAEGKRSETEAKRLGTDKNQLESSDLSRLHATPTPLKYTVATGSGGSGTTRQYRILPELKSGTHFVVVSNGLWRLLRGWYGGDPPLKRPVVARGSPGESPIVETSPCEVRVQMEDKTITVLSSRFSAVSAVTQAVCSHFVLSKSQVRLVDPGIVSKRHPIPISDTQTLHGCGVTPSDAGACVTLLAQIRLPTGTFPPIPIQVSTGSLAEPRAAATGKPKPRPLRTASSWAKDGGCYVCGGAAPGGDAMKKCGSCRVASYCSVDCQRAHWRFHKVQCKLARSLVKQSSAREGASRIAQARKLVTRPMPIVGLQNHGNTCYLNSAIQCLRSVTELSRAFLSNLFKADINTTNVLGKQGRLATAYGAMLQDFCLGSASSPPSGNAKPAKGRSFSPRKFLLQMRTLLPDFTLGRQHDAHEFLSILLDNLHEDMNRVRAKPYVSLSDAGDRSDDDVAMEHWRNHLRRNQGLVVDLFQGQYKSTLVCSVCDYTARKFEPFWSVTLPIPERELRTMRVVVHPNTYDDSKSAGAGDANQQDHSSPPTSPTLRDAKKNEWSRRTVPVQLTVRMGARAAVATLKDAVAELCGADPSSMVVTALRGRRFYKVYGDGKPVAKIGKGEVLHIFNSTVANKDRRAAAQPPLYQGRFILRLYDPDADVEGGDSAGATLFGMPVVADFPSDATGRDLYDTVSRAISNFATTGRTGSGAGDEAKDSLLAKEARASANPFPFTLRIVNPTGIRCGNKACPYTAQTRDDPTSPAGRCMGCEVPCEGTSVGQLLRDRQTIAVDFRPAEAKSCVSETRSQMFDVLHSVSGQSAQSAARQFDIYDCFRTFSTAETLGAGDEWYCPRCKTHVQATKKMQLWRLPEIIVLHLNRFKSASGATGREGRMAQMMARMGLGSSHQKNKEEIKFPLKGLDLSAFTQSGARAGGGKKKHRHKVPKYDLISVCHHYGSVGFGHYTASIRSNRPVPDSKKTKDEKGQAERGCERGQTDDEAGYWYMADDDTVTRVRDLEKLQGSTAYMLFYRRRVPG